MAVSYRIVIAAAAVALLLSSCSKEANEVPAAQASASRPAGPYTVMVGDLSGRSVLGSDDRGRFGKWEDGDKMGYIVTDEASGSSRGAGAISPGSPSSFFVYHAGGFAGGETVRAYYPYNAATTDPANVAMGIPISQSQTQDGFDFDAMPLVSSPVIIPGPLTDTDVPLGEVYFANLASVAEFRIFSSGSQYAGETVSSVTFEGTAPLAGVFTADISGMDILDSSTLVISGYSETAATTTVSPALAVGGSQQTAVSVFMVLAPGTYGGTVTVTTDKAVYRFPLRSEQTFRRSVIRSLGVDLASCTDRTSTSVNNLVTVTKTMSQIFSGMGITPVNAEKYEVLRLDDVITIETNGYNNCGRYYTAGGNWRVYAADYGNIKIKAAPGYELQSVSMAYSIQSGTGGVYPSFDGPASGKTAQVSGCSVTYHVGNALGHLRFTKFTVTYIESSFKPSRIYLDCNEMPALDITVSATGLETFGDDESSFSAVWHEFDLPRTDRKVITHTFRYNSSTVRNYTAMVEQGKRCPLWVAYPMHGVAYRNNAIDRVGSFNEKHSYDPAIPASWQSSGSTKDGSSSSPYSRGHLCASEDRQVTDDSNRQTFYYTNQVPQWQNSFNSGVWSSLETAVQSKAAGLTARDTLYVVSGALYEGGATGDSNDGGVVARPSHMYKLLMLCSFDASGMMTAAKGAAYLYENVAHTGAKYYDSNYKTTIDAIEQRAGFDFFAAVPASLQDGAESAFSSIL